MLACVLKTEIKWIQGVLIAREKTPQNVPNPTLTTVVKLDSPTIVGDSQNGRAIDRFVYDFAIYQTNPVFSVLQLSMLLNYRVFVQYACHNCRKLLYILCKRVYKICAKIRQRYKNDSLTTICKIFMIRQRHIYL